MNIDNIYEDLIRNIAKEKVLFSEPMSKHTSFKVGGNADIFIKTDDILDIKLVLSYVKQNNIPLFILGNGTNVLVKDNGIRGIVLKIDTKGISLNTEGYIKVQAGCTLTQLSQVALKYSLTGLEALAGIPGTIGGAIKMNAGAYGTEMKDIVVSTTYIDENCEVKTINCEEHNFSYRHSIFCERKYVIIETTIKLKNGDSKEISTKMHEFKKQRKEKQPLEFPNAGSTFKRLSNKYTAQLIDEAGLKGHKIGGAQVSEKHAGFIINTGNATARDIINLIEFIQKEIKRKFNETIELEIIIVGD